MRIIDAEIQGLVRQLHEVTAASPDAWGEVDLTLRQLRALFVLGLRQPTRVGELASALGMSLASASALSARLVRLGYVARQHPSEDHRAVQLVLSRKGAGVLDGLQRRTDEQLGRSIRKMTAAERTALKVSLRALVRVAPRVKETS